MNAQQALSLAGASITDTIMLVIRHNEDLNNVKKYPEAEYKGDKYKVTNWSVDDQLNAFDIVTLKKIEKH